MAGLFRKRNCNKPWIASSITSKSTNLKSKVVKVLCRRSESVHGSRVMIVSDGELSISAVFTDLAIHDALSDLGVESVNWSTSLLILHKYSLELKAKPEQDYGEYELHVEKFNIWNLQPGYQAKYDVKNCMEHVKVFERMKEELKERKERAACQSESSVTGSVALTQLLEEIARPSTDLSQSQVDSEPVTGCVTDLTESLLEKLVQPFTVEEFLIPAAEASILDNIEEWKPDYQPSPSEEPEESHSDQLFDVCIANTLTQDPGIRNTTKHLEKTNSEEVGKDIEYLGISFTSSPEEIVKEVTVGRQFPGPVCALLKVEAESQSQGASSQWQEELESVRFSFEEESNARDSQGSPEEHYRPVNKETTMVNLAPKESDRLATKENAELNPTSLLTLASLEKDSLKHVIINSPQEESCVSDSEKCPGQKYVNSDGSAEVTHEVMSDESPKGLADEPDFNENTGSKKVISNRNSSEEMCKTVLSKTSFRGEICTLTMDCLDIGSPTAQSTQIDAVVDVTPEPLLGHKKRKEGDLIETNGEGEIVSVKVNKTSYVQSQNSSRSSEQTESSDFVSQVDNCLELSKNDAGPLQAIDNESSGTTETVDQKHESTDTSQENTNDSSLNDLDRSVMRSYYSQNFSSPDCHRLNDMSRMAVRKKQFEALSKIARKRKQLEALKYVTKRISGVNEPNKSGVSEKLNSQYMYNTINIQEERIKEKRMSGSEINGKQSEDPEGTAEVRCDLSQEESDEKVKQQEETMSKKTEDIAETDSKNVEGENTIEERETSFCNISEDTENDFSRESASRLLEVNDEDSTQQNSFATTDTGYPVSSLSLKESLEESHNCAQLYDAISNQTNIEDIDRVHCIKNTEHAKSGSRKECGQDSDQTDLEEIDKAHQKCIKVTKEKTRVPSKEVNTLMKEEIRPTLDGYPIAPWYFDTESGSKKRSEKLYAKVISCREKDNQINRTYELCKTLVAPVLQNSGNKSDINRSERNNEYFQNIEVDEHIAGQSNEFSHSGSASYVQANPDMNVVNATDQYDKDLPDKNSSETICNVNSGCSMELRSKLTLNDNVRGEVENCEEDIHTRTVKNCTRNIFGSTCAKQKHPELMKDGLVSDIRIVLERCDESEKKYFENKNTETQKNAENHNKVWEAKLMDFTECMSGRVTRQSTEPFYANSRNTLNKTYTCSSSGTRIKLRSQKSTEEVDDSDKLGVYPSNNSLPALKVTLKKLDSAFYTVKTDHIGRRNTESEMAIDSTCNNLESEITDTEKGTAKVTKSKSGIEIVTESSSDSFDTAKTPGSINNEILAEEKAFNVSDGRNRSNFVVFSDLENSESKRVSLVSRENGTNSEPEMKAQVERKADKTDGHQEENENNVSVNRIKLKKYIVAHTFEDQFKTWLMKGHKNKIEENGHNSLTELTLRGYSTDPVMQTMNGIKDGEKTNIKESSLLVPENVQLKNSLEYAKLPDSHDKSGNIFVTDKDAKKECSMEHSEKDDIPDPVHSTQAFDICPYPQTQEFSPKTSDTQLQLSLTESFTTHNNGSSLVNKSHLDIDTVPGLAGHNCLDISVTEKTIKLESHVTKDSKSYSNVETHDSTIKDVSEMGKESTDKSLYMLTQTIQGHEKENISGSDSNPCLNSQLTRDTLSSNKQPLVDQLSSNLQSESPESESVLKSATDKKFTKLIGKSEHMKTFNDFWAVSKPEKLNLKVKPVQRKVIQRKRKLDNVVDDVNKIKKHKHVDIESKEDLKARNSQKDREGVQNRDLMNVVTDYLDDSLEGFNDSLKTSSRRKALTATKGKFLEKEAAKVDKDKSESQDSLVHMHRSKNPVKTYEPHKMFIDGHCFGNRVFWQNFVESPYTPSKQISSETKTKSYVEKTNKRKLSLDSSQDSQTNDTSYRQCKTKDDKNEKVNRSSESLFSDENEPVDTKSDSVSLLQCKKIEIKELGSNNCVRKGTNQRKPENNVAAHNEHEHKSIGNGKLRYCKKGGLPRFYRADYKTDVQNKEPDNSTEYSAVSKKGTPQSNVIKSEKERDSGKTSSDRVCKKVNGNPNRVTRQKTFLDKEQNNSGKTRDKMTEMKANLDNKTFLKSKSISVDKEQFIQDWLMKHKEVGQGESGSQELSPPDIFTPGSSLPSYQPVANTRGEVHGEEQEGEEQEGKDNSVDGTSTSETSSGSESEDSNKPMSAAAKYLMKLKKARKERKRRKLLAFRSKVRNQCHDYLESCDRF